VSAVGVLSALLVLAGGLPMAYAVTRRLPLALLFAPIATALLASAAVALMLLAGGDLRAWLAVLLAVECAVAALLLRHRAGTPLPHGRWTDAAWLALPMLPPFLYAVRAPEQWDAHSIWWLHAAYFVQGADVARQDMSSPALLFTHADYPPLASAPVAAVWAVLPRYEFGVAQLVSTLLTLSAVTMLAYAVRRVTARAPVLVSRSAAVAVGLAVWSTEPGAVGTGMSDPVWAAACVAGAVPLLVGDRPFERPALALLLLASAALTKNEGLVAVTVVAVLVTLRQCSIGGRPRWPGAWRVWLPVAGGLAWVLLARHLGAGSDLLAGGRFDPLDPAVRARLGPTLAALAGSAGWAVVLAALVAVLGAAFLRRRRGLLRLGSDLWLWALGAAYAGSLVVTYLISPHDLRWHLATSASRVTLPLVLLACVSAACWCATAIGVPARHAAASSVPRQPVGLR
jgi:hypothetical protein